DRRHRRGSAAGRLLAVAVAATAVATAFRLRQFRYVQNQASVLDLPCWVMVRSILTDGNPVALPDTLRPSDPPSSITSLTDLVAPTGWEPDTCHPPALARSSTVMDVSV